MIQTNHETFIDQSTSGFDTSDTIGGRISRAREAGGYSLAQLARRLGVKTATLKMWETDRSEPRSNRLAMLAAFLNVSPTWLLVGKGESPTNNTQSDEINLLETEIEAIQSSMMGLHQRLSEIVDRLKTLKSREAQNEDSVEQEAEELAQAS